MILRNSKVKNWEAQSRTRLNALLNQGLTKGMNYFWISNLLSPCNMAFFKKHSEISNASPCLTAKSSLLSDGLISLQMYSWGLSSATLQNILQNLREVFVRQSWKHYKAITFKIIFHSKGYDLRLQGCKSYLERICAWHQNSAVLKREAVQSCHFKYIMLYKSARSTGCANGGSEKVGLIPFYLPGKHI